MYYCPHKVYTTDSGIVSIQQIVAIIIGRSGKFMAWLSKSPSHPLLSFLPLENMWENYNTHVPLSGWPGCVFLTNEI